MAKDEDKQVLVIQYEQFFDANDAGDLPEAVRQTLESMRMYAGGRVVGSYMANEDDEFHKKALTHITVTQPIRIEVD